MTAFKDLTIGKTFDFIAPDSYTNSFFERCIKVSESKYAEVNRPEMVHTVGTVKVKVYHVGDAAE